MRGDADDLVMLAGYGLADGDTVIYQAVADGMLSPAPPTQPPLQSTSELGMAPIVSSLDAPYSLTIKLPGALRPDQPYALWIRTSRGEWSQAIEINDPRPLWITPAYAYSTAPVAYLPRELKVVGRNLEGRAGQRTFVQLVGPRRYTMVVKYDEPQSSTMDRYVARAGLPEFLVPGVYRIQFSRDGVAWLEVPDQTFEVRTDPPSATEYSVNEPRFGGCRPDDGIDDTRCIVAAIAAAKLAGGGVVTFGPGTWDLVEITQPGVTSGEGIVVPDGVGLRGAGSNLTRLQRHPEWNAKGGSKAFTLAGHNIVTGFSFRDLQTYQSGDRAASFLQVGDNSQRGAGGRAAQAPETTADEIIITRNTFDKTFVAVTDAGMPIKHLFVTYNAFGAYFSALELGGNRYNMTQQYRLDDSVIVHNVFKPGSKLDLGDKIGPIASEIGAGHRLDFSDNTADGSSTEYLNSPNDPRGWRAAFFWSLEGNVEETLIAHNTATCTGDKIGDGEAIAFDNNTNTFAFPSAPILSGASSATFTVAVPLVTRQNNRDIPVSTYYVGHWVQILGGPGLGQVRKVIGYTRNSVTGLTTFRVVPDWDVVPVAGQSRVSVGREYWQVLAIDNLIDHRQPLCQKSNRSRHAGGVITVYAQSSDSVVEGNRQYDTDGIFLHQGYIVPEHPCPECAMEGFFQSFLEIRSNAVDGEYDWTTDCGSSGIVADIFASPWNHEIPPTVSFGLDISHNTIRHADGPKGGAIALYNSWYSGPDPRVWPLSDGVLIQHNLIEDIDGTRAIPA
ncbi:MAG: hypothetical protein ABSH33_18185, partial [Steroidobacteraceae bacterium]